MESITKRKVTLVENEDKLAKRSKPVATTDSDGEVDENQSSGSDTSNEPVQEVLMVYNGTSSEDTADQLQRRGASATKLCIKYHIIGIDKLLDSIKKNCSENIMELEFLYAGDGDNRSKQEFEDGRKYLQVFLRECGVHFPNLKKLKVSYLVNPTPKDMKMWEDIAYKFPSLIGLTIENCQKFPIVELCEENPQLEHLALNKCKSWSIKYGLLESIDEKLPNLKGLQIECKIVKEANQNNFGRLRFEKLQKLSVVSKTKSYTEMLEFVNCMGTAIEEVTVVSNASKTTFNDATIDMIAGFEKLKKLSVGKDLTDNQLKKLLEKVPHIEDLKIGSGKVGKTGVVAFIKNANKLSKMSISFDDKKDAENSSFLNIRVQWAISINGTDIVFEKPFEN